MRILLQTIRSRLLSILIVGSIILLFFEGCGGIQLSVYSSPYRIISGAITIVSDSSNTDACYKIAGITFQLQNLHDISITKVNVSFRLYTVEDNSTYSAFPNYTTNMVETSISTDVDAYSTSTVCMSLDEMMTYIPSKSLLAKPFVIQAIYYKDGSIWEDTYEIYKTEIP